MHTLTAGLGMADLSIPGWERTTDGTPLVARCLLLDDGDTRLAIVSLTVIALRRAEALLVREAVAQAGATPPEHVMIACTHVHMRNSGEPRLRPLPPHPHARPGRPPMCSRHRSA